jgi:hypothetical protein
MQIARADVGHDIATLRLSQLRVGLATLAALAAVADPSLADSLRRGG